MKTRLDAVVSEKRCKGIFVRYLRSYLEIAACRNVLSRPTSFPIDRAIVRIDCFFARALERVRSTANRNCMTYGRLRANRGATRCIRAAPTTRLVTRVQRLK